MDELYALLQEFTPIDTHFHYFHCLDQGAETQKELDRAFQHGLHAAVDAGTSSHPFTQRKDLALRYAHVYLLAGYHPDAAKDPAVLDLKALEEELRFEKTIAVGEIGLDYSYDIEKKDQQHFFATQLEMAKKIQKPVVLHVREANEDALAMISEHGIECGIVHCFTGNTTIAKRWLDQGFYLSFSGIATFKNATDVQASAVYTPLDRLFCETDAPFLAPVPHRGKPNQAAFVAYVYHHLCSLRGLAPAEFSQQLAENFFSFCHQMV